MAKGSSCIYIKNFSFLALKLREEHEVTDRQKDGWYIQKTLQKTVKTTRNLKFLRKWVDLESALQILTSQFFGQAYYGAAVWLNDMLTYENWQSLERQHYRALRATVGDYKCTMPRSTLNEMSGRATPKQWSRYITTSTAIKIINNQCTGIAVDLHEAAYTNDRLPKRAKFINKANMRIGNHYLKNRLQALNTLSFDWIGDYTDEHIRKNLKKAFFKQSTNLWSTSLL